MFALVPILAQAANLAVGDRTEVRARFDKYSGTAEASTSPFASVELADKRWNLQLRYSPSLTLTRIDGYQDRTLIVFHTAQLVGQLRLRRFSLSLSEAGSYGERNFFVDALGYNGTTTPPLPAGGLVGTPAAPGAPQTPGPGGTTGTGTTGTGTTNPATNPTVAANLDAGTVRYGSSTTQANLGYAASRRTTTGAYARYMVSGGLDDRSKQYYPIIRNPSFGAFYGYQFSPRSGIGTNLQGSYSTSSLGIQTYTADINAGYRYRFSKAFAVTFGLGVGYARVIYADGDVLEYVYLAAGVGSGLSVEYRTKFQQGLLTLYARVGYAPALDQLTALLDQRLSWGVGATWTRKRLALYAGVASSISLKVTDTGAFDVFNAAIGGSYTLGGGFTTDAGVRGTWQAFEGKQTIPPSCAVFVGLSWGGNKTLGGGR